MPMRKEILDELLKEYKSPDDLLGPVDVDRNEIDLGDLLAIQDVRHGHRRDFDLLRLELSFLIPVLQVVGIFFLGG
jgi:hypothetical protein